MRSQGVDVVLIPASAHGTNPASGVMAGLEAGYDFQFSPNWLVGAEVDLSWSAASGNFTSLDL